LNRKHAEYVDQLGFAQKEIRQAILKQIMLFLQKQQRSQTCASFS
jgi:hypothetical protein